MHTAKIIAKNTSLLFFSQVLASILFFFSTLYSARYLGTTGFGILSTALALTVILGLLSDLGLGTLTTREIARNKSLAKKYIGNLLVMKIMLAFLTFGSIILVSKLFYSTEVLEVTCILAISVILDSFSNIFYSVFQGYEKMEYQSLGRVFGTILIFLGVIIAIYFELSIIAFAYIYLFVSLIIVVYTFIVCSWRFFLPKVEIDLNFWKNIIIQAFPLSLALIFGVIYFRIDMVFLSILKGSDAVGIYSAAYRLMDFFIFIPLIFTSSILPVLSRFHISSKDSLKISYKLSFKYLFIVGLPIAVGTTILANDIITLIYTAEFTQATQALQILIWTVPILFLTYLLSTLITSINKQDLLYKIMLISMIFNILLNLTLIPRFSYLGSSIVTLISELIVFILCFHYVSRFVCKIKVKITFKPLIASAIMGLSIFYLHINLLLSIIIGLIIYLVSLIVLKTFAKKEIDLFRQVVSF